MERCVFSSARDLLSPSGSLHLLTEDKVSRESPFSLRREQDAHAKRVTGGWGEQAGVM